MIYQQAYVKKKKLACQGVVHIRLNRTMGNAQNDDSGGSTQTTVPQRRACPQCTQ